MDEFARLRWRCRRGMLELDVLLGAFLERGYTSLDAEDRGVFEEMIALPDQALLQCLLGSEPPPCQGWDHVIARIRHAAHPPA